METIGRLTGGIAHDFNNILGSIMLNAELAIEDVDEHSETAYSLNQILDASHRAKTLIEQILAFSRNTSADKVPFNITVILKETIKMLKSAFPATIRLKINIAYNVGTTCINPVEIQQLMINLCTNAVHAMEDKGGTLTIKLKNTRLTGTTAKQANLPPGQYVKLSISDTGKGIEPDDINHICDPFFTTKNNGKGTGMGLSVGRTIMQDHDGGITVDSKPGKGTTVDVLFPTTRKNDSRKKTASRPKSNRGKNILFVDDEAALCDVGTRMLTRMGYSVVATQSSKKALDLLKKQPENFDLVITDMTMPYMTGIELTEKLLKIRHDLPIILCSGFNEALTRQKADEVGIRKFIMKPYAPTDLFEIISNIFTGND